MANLKNSFFWFGVFAVSLIITIALIGPYFDKAEGITRTIGIVFGIISAIGAFMFAKLQFFTKK